jgi:hypothetical protein
LTKPLKTGEGAQGVPAEFYGEKGEMNVAFFERLIQEIEGGFALRESHAELSLRERHGRSIALPQFFREL